MSIDLKTQKDRRTFLRGAGGLLLVKSRTAFGTQANSAIEAGIIGCGGRGIFIGDFFQEYGGARLVALADPFEDRMANTVKKLSLQTPRLYGGLDGYQKLIASRLDAVAIMSPPYFHPEQVEAAVSAGKHVFLAKPVAVDVWGCESIAASGRRAAGKLSFLVDFQTRSQPVFQEAARRVHSGAIGFPVLGHVYYHTGRIRPQTVAGLSEEQNRLRNWVFDKALSGDIIVEQNIHVLDTASWYLRSRPEQAFGTGGRKARVDVGDCWDHFLVQYWHPEGVKVDFSSAQFTRGYNDLCIRIYGSEGTLDSHYAGAVRITGDRPWEGAEKDPTFREGAVKNVQAFVESLRTGKYLNNVEPSVESNLVSVLGRMAAYQQKTVTWQEMMRSGERLDAQLRL